MMGKKELHPYQIKDIIVAIIYQTNDLVMSKKQRYKVRNWKEYNEALVKLGSLTFWFDEEVIAAWHDVEKTDCRGRPPVYSDVAILCALSLKVIFQLPLRATCGLLGSLIELMGLPLKVPDYTTLSRRQSKLSLEIPFEANFFKKHLPRNLEKTPC